MQQRNENVNDHKTYDYENFVGSSVSKGRKELMSGEFELAEKWFAQTLEEDPGDFEANRGMILCAGKWRDFPDIRLNEKLKFAEWPKIEERLKAAKENSNYNNLEYFEEFQKMLESVKTYHELAGKEDQESLFERLTAQKSFKLRYKVFAGMDRKYRTTYMNKPLLALSEKEKRENLRTALGCGDFVAADREYLSLVFYRLLAEETFAWSTHSTDLVSVFAQETCTFNQSAYLRTVAHENYIRVLVALCTDIQSIAFNRRN